jgi:porphyrinogen peroxidase
VEGSGSTVTILAAPSHDASWRIASATAAPAAPAHPAAVAEPGQPSGDRRRAGAPAMIGRMSTPQSGIFALGTASHAYLELDLRAGAGARALVGAVADLREPRTTIGGVNLVAGFRPELWRGLAPGGVPPGVAGFDQDLVGAGGYVLPATQHDALLWLSGSAYDVLFDMARQAIATLAPLACVAEESSGWPYRHDRDLTGFVDGTENPSLVEAPEVALVPEGRPGAGGTVLLLQKWAHDAPAWEALPVAEQERAMGRTKLDSVELADRAPESHVARTDQERFGDIFRRNMPYGTTIDHGTLFVGFSAEQQRLAAMLESMAGVTDGVRDALTSYTRPVTGAYYFVPSTGDLGRFARAEDAD